MLGDEPFEARMCGFDSYQLIEKEKGSSVAMRLSASLGRSVLTPQLDCGRPGFPINGENKMGLQTNGPQYPTHQRDKARRENDELDTIETIESEKDYEAAMAELDSLMILDPPRNAPEADRLIRLAALIKNWEVSHSSGNLI